MLLGFGNLKFCENEYGQSSSPSFKSLVCLDRILWKLVEDTLKHHYDVISSHRVSKLAYFVENDIGYQFRDF